MCDIFGRPKSSFCCVIIIFTMFSSWWGVHMSSVMRRFVAGGHFPIFSLTPLKIILTDQNSRVVLLVIDILTSVLIFCIFNFYSWLFCENFICFEFYHSIPICDILFFSIWSLFFQLFFCPLVKLIFLFNFTL